MAFFSFISLLCLFTTSGAYSTLSDYTLQNLPSPGTDYNIHTGKLLAPILIPRVPGTEGSVTVLNHFASFFRTNLPDWSLEFQNSTAKTPVTGDKDVPFVNLIATRDPPEVAPGEVSRLTLVAHYDSKLTPEGFIGAIDSAAPCAMLMHAARSVDAALSRKWGATEIDMEDFTEAKGVQIIFLDGEEAFHKWTDSDSLYGARSLAEAWEQTPNPAFSTFHNPLASISLFLLLDLLGAKGSKIPSYFKSTHWAYQKMAALESRLRALGLFKSSPNHSSKRTSNGQTGRRDEPMFLVEADKSDNRFLGWMVQDDHVPFMARGVEVLHMIPTPFPSVWHQMTDDGEHLDLDTVEDWGQLVTAFVGEWMDLEGYFDDSGPVSEALEQKKALHERGGAPTGKTEL